MIKKNTKGGLAMYPSSKKIVMEKYEKLYNILKNKKIVPNITGDIYDPNNINVINQQLFSAIIGKHSDNYCKSVIKNSKTMELIKMMNNTENGIYNELSNDKNLILLEKEKKGGTIELLNNYTKLFNKLTYDQIKSFIMETSDSQIIESYINYDDYEPRHNTLPMYKNTIIDTLLKLETENDVKEKYPEIHDILLPIYKVIYPLKQEYCEIFELNVEKYDLNSSNLVEIKPYIFKKSFTFNDYNAGIIKGYELPLLQCKEHYQRFIDYQIRYLKSLSIHDARCIRDYTNVIAFTHYINKYKQNIFNIEDIKASPEAKKIGDIFAYFVFMYITDQGKTTIKQRLDENDDLKLLCKDFIVHFNNHSLPKNDEECHPIYYELLDNDDWNIILKNFMINLNKLILQSPETKEELIVYRGSRINYAYTNGMYNNIPYYQNDRIVSYSFNYHASKSYYDKFDKSDNIIYRVIVPIGSRVLFTTPFINREDITHELEIITFENQILIPTISILQKHFKSKPHDIFKTIEDNVYNNINMTNNIVLDPANKIRSHKSLMLLPSDTLLSMISSSLEYTSDISKFPLLLNYTLKLYSGFNELTTQSDILYVM